MPTALGPLTIDASVFLSAANPAEADHGSSRRLLERIGAEGSPIVVPTLVLPEVTAEARRATGSAEIARRLATALTRDAAFIFVSLDDTLARAAAEIAADRGIKGSDAVYGATARRFGTTLVTLDREQRERMPPDVTAVTPAVLLEV